MQTNWTERKKPARLEKRIEFNDYEQTREFLEQAADLAEKEGYYPDLSFGRTYVSVAIYSEGEVGEISGSIIDYANEMDKLAEAARNIC